MVLLVRSKRSAHVLTFLTGVSGTRAMAEFTVSSKGRTYVRGKSIDESLRSSVIDYIIGHGGDPASGLFGGQYSQVAERFSVSAQFVSKLWRQFCTTGEHLPAKKKSGNPSRLKPEDVELIEFLKREKPSVPYQTIQTELEKYSTLEGGTSLSAIGMNSSVIYGY